MKLSIVIRTCPPSENCVTCSKSVGIIRHSKQGGKDEEEPLQFKHLEDENRRLKQIVEDLTLFSKTKSPIVLFTMCPQLRNEELTAITKWINRYGQARSEKGIL